MDVSGSQKITASREKVFNALLDPTVLKSAVPGCESADFFPYNGERLIKLVITTAVPGFKGPYSIFIRTSEVNPPSHVVLVTENGSSQSNVNAACTVDLSDDPAGTSLNYKAHTELSGKLSAVPELVLKPAIKGGLDKFFSSFEKQVSGS